MTMPTYYPGAISDAAILRREDARAWRRTMTAIAVGGFLAIFAGTLGASAAIDALVAQGWWPGMYSGEITE